jgi:Tfp pilus assembly pilus retraction ATPase PilT
MVTAIQTGKEAGMCTLDQSLQLLVAQQTISLEAAREAATNKEIFK